MLKEYVCRVEGEFPEGKTECSQPVEVVSYKIGVCKVENLNNLNTLLYHFLTGVYAW